jgi:plasmid stabilization system protein ParE
VIPATPFIVAYRVAKGRIEILGIVHGARRWPERF